MQRPQYLHQQQQQDSVSPIPPLFQGEKALDLCQPRSKVAGPLTSPFEESLTSGFAVTGRLTMAFKSSPTRDALPSKGEILYGPEVITPTHNSTIKFFIAEVVRLGMRF